MVDKTPKWLKAVVSFSPVVLLVVGVSGTLTGAIFAARVTGCMPESSFYSSLFVLPLLFAMGFVPLFLNEIYGAVVLAGLSLIGFILSVWISYNIGVV